MNRIDMHRYAMYNESDLHVAFEMADTFLKSVFHNPDAHLWEQDAVGVMAWMRPVAGRARGILSCWFG